MMARKSDTAKTAAALAQVAASEARKVSNARALAAIDDAIELLIEAAEAFEDHPRAGVLGAAVGRAVKLLQTANGHLDDSRRASKRQ